MKRLKAFVDNPVEKSGEVRPFYALEQIEPGLGRIAPGTEIEERLDDTAVLHRPGDVRFGKLRPYLAKSLYMTDHGHGSGELLVLRSRPESMHGRFLHYLTLSKPFIEWATATSYGVKMPRTSWEALSSYPADPPSLEEQHRIADYLDAETARIDELIAEQTRLARLLRARFEAWSTQQLLAGLNPVTGAATGAGHQVSRLGSALTLSRGHDLPSQDRRPGDVPVISSGGVSGHHDTAKHLGPGVVTGRYGTVGEVYFVESPYWPLNTALYVADFKGNHPRWCFHLLRRLPLNADSAKSAVTGINRNVVHRLYIRLPDREDQRSLAEQLDRRELETVEAESAITEQYTLLQEHRQALVTHAVTQGIDGLPGVT